jgi:hypothetical protein
VHLLRSLMQLLPSWASIIRPLRTRWALLAVLAVSRRLFSIPLPCLSESSPASARPHLIDSIFLSHPLSRVRVSSSTIQAFDAFCLVYNVAAQPIARMDLPQV